MDECISKPFTHRELLDKIGVIGLHNPNHEAEGIAPDETPLAGQ
jgi:hypothetical protein